MDHSSFMEKITEYLDGELKGNELAEFEIHMMDCRHCRNYLLKVKTIQGAVADYLVHEDASELIRILVPEAVFREMREQKEESKPISLILKVNDKVRSWIKNLGSLEKYKDLGTGDLPCWLFSTAGTRSVSAAPKTFQIGEEITFLVEPSQDGHLILFNYAEPGNFRLLFPTQKTDETFIKAGDELLVPFVAAEPQGQQVIKAIMTTDELIRPQEVDFDSVEELSRSIEEMLGKLLKLPSENVAVKNLNYQVSL